MFYSTFRNGEECVNKYEVKVGWIIYLLKRQLSRRKVFDFTPRKGTNRVNLYYSWEFHCHIHFFYREIQSLLIIYSMQMMWSWTDDCIALAKGTLHRQSSQVKTYPETKNIIAN